METNSIKVTYVISGEPGINVRFFKKADFNPANKFCQTLRDEYGTKVMINCGFVYENIFS